MKLIIPGGSGHVGQGLRRHFEKLGHEVIVLSRKGPIEWDGKTLGDWTRHLERADAVINLAGKSVNCRYNKKNLQEMMASRVDSARIIGEAIRLCTYPPKVWLQASTATIYDHRFDASNDDASGEIGKHRVPSPISWNHSIEIASAWEDVVSVAETPRTRKVAMRSAMIMSRVPGSVFEVLLGLAKRGLLGRFGQGNQFVSWVHESDFCAAVDWLIADESLSGPINIASPGPLPQAEFARELRQAAGIAIGLPSPAWLLNLGCFFMQSEPELVLKSRRVVSSLLPERGFEFRYPTWAEAVRALLHSEN